MSRVVITGLGVVSSLGNSAPEVRDALWRGSSGIVFVPEMQALGFKCCLFGPVRPLSLGLIPKKARRTMAKVAQYAMAAAFEAVADAGLEPTALESERVGIVLGTGLGGIGEVTQVQHLLESGLGLSRAGANGPVRIMSSTAAANLASFFGVRGRVHSFSSACCTGLDNIGAAYEYIRFGLLDACLAGAAEEDCWRQVGASFDNSGEMPRDWNDRPSRACRPYDRDRQGFVLSEGAGVLVLESLEHARARGARIYAEIVAYAASNDGADMFRPTGEGLRRALGLALALAGDQGVRTIDYINPHGTGTHIGDSIEVQAIKELFGASPYVSSTKGLTGHALGATGALEAVYTLLMLSGDFVAATANLENVASDCLGIRHAQGDPVAAPLRTAITFNSGLGSTNSCLVLKKWEES